MFFSKNLDNYICLKMTILEYYYNEQNEILYVEFSMYNDGDDFYRVLELDLEEIEYYSPIIIESIDINDLNEDFIIDIITEYLKHNDPPEQQIL